ncbi:MAG TPA: F0F1 ATP synthase subunit B [Xanthomonadaceae bacterium]|nr:F0F1 ATP synthase subunit B [Xanthomonadaceae bacterium]
MELDGFTVAAQVGNFLLLLWLLKRFLYRPILEAMAARQQRIAAALAEAQAQAAAAEALRQDYLARQRDLAASRESWLIQAREEVAAQRQTWLAQARTEVDEARERWRAELEREQRDYRQTLQREAARRLLALTRRALHDLANAELEAHMASTLLARLQTLDRETRQTLARAARDGCVILTVFPLPEPQRRVLTTGLQQLLDPGLNPEFRTDPAASPGITLETPSQRLAWTLDSYLDGFAAELQTQVLSEGNSGA